MTLRVPHFALGLSASLLTACAHGISLSTGNSNPPDPALLLSCARAVALDQGLGVLSPSQEPLRMEAKSTVAPSAPADRGGAPSYDVLTVTLSPAKKGFRMLVGSASYVLRQLRGGAVTTGAPGAAKTEWVGTSPSTRVALARDAVLSQCGSVGN